jgi:hypothetical protein
MRTFLIEVEDDPQCLGKTLVSLYECDWNTVYGQGKPCGSISVPTEQHVGQGVKALFSGQFGHPEPPPLRDLPASSNGKLCAAVDGSGDLMWKPADVDRSQSPGA